MRTLRVDRVTVLTGFGADRISLFFPELPSPLTTDHEEVTCAQLEATHGTGVEWVRRNLGIEPTIIDRKLGIVSEPQVGRSK